MRNYKNLLENANMILKSIRKVLHEENEKESVIDEATTLRETNTPEFKEGLVVYFSSLPVAKLKQIEDKLNKPETSQKKISIPEPTEDEY
jgi:hypothetical protein